jgi:hypothetical protein
MGAAASAFKGLLPPNPMDLIDDPVGGIGHALAPHRGFSPLGDLESKIEKGFLGTSPIDNLSGVNQPTAGEDPDGNNFQGTVANDAFEGTQSQEKRVKKAASGSGRRRSTTSLASQDGYNTLLGS